jgi:pimeloyl-ACP methyl ester carboxylesterase
MAHGGTAFIAAMGFKQVDLLGFSIGSFVAQEIALLRPDVVRRWSSRPRRQRVRWACTAGPQR